MLHLTFFLFCLWLTLSGVFEPFFLSSGVFSAFIVTGLVHHLIKYLHLKHSSINIINFIFSYIPKLLWAILKENLAVAKIILFSNANSGFVEINNHKVEDTSSLIVIAHSITLTPGTITVHCDKDKVIIHALDTSDLEGIEGSIYEFNEWLKNDK